jgi:lysyl-tRNA synthetase class II
MGGHLKEVIKGCVKIIKSSTAFDFEFQRNSTLYIPPQFPHGVSVNLRERKRSDEIDPDVDSEVVVAGWVQTIRKKGKIAFILLRDRGGVVQITALKNEIEEKSLEQQIFQE